MKQTLIIIVILIAQQLNAQDTTVYWLRNIDSLDFNISFKKSKILKDFYQIIGIERLKEIANPNEFYSAGCVVKQGLPRQQLQWIAKDKNKHWIISVAYGGLALRTHYYFFDYDKEKLNINELGIRNCSLTFGEVIREISSGEFNWEEININDYE